MRRGSANFLIAALSLVLVAAGAEGYLRWRAGTEREALRARLGERGPCTEASPDRRLIYTYRPGECGSNSRGFRDVEHTPEKPPRTYRIVLIGDSVAEGRDVDPDSTFGRILEREMNARGEGYHYEVILLARSGYSTSQEIELLRTEAFRYHPDLILWSYCLNDPADPVYHDANGSLGRYYYRPRSYLMELFRAAWFRVRQHFLGRNCPTEFHAFVHCAYWKDIVRNLHRIASIAGERHVPVILVIHPIFEDKPSFDSYSLAGVHERLAAAARGAGMETIDLLQAFRRYPPAELKIHRADYFDPWHLNDKGHRVTADFICRRLMVTGPGP